MMCQMFSIGERSALQAGQFSTWTIILQSHAVVIAAEYGFALSCWNIRHLEGSICFSKTFIYLSEFIMPYKICKLPTPFFDDVMHCRWWDLKSLCNLTLRNIVFKVFHNLFTRSFTDWRASAHLLLQPFVAPLPTFLRPVAGIKFDVSSFNGYKCKVSPLKHLLCSLCSIVNKVLARVIWKSFV